MKTRNIWNLLLIVPLILAVAAGPVRAQSNEQPGTPPAAPAPPAPEAQSATNGNRSSNTAAASEAAAKKAAESARSVRIVNGNIHFRGPYVQDGPKGLEIVALVAVLATAFVLPVALLAVFLYFRNRRNTLLHETLRAMVDKGVPIPPELLTTRMQNTPRRRSNDLRRGLICAGVGLGLLMLAWASHGPGKIGLIGFIPLFVGAAFLISWKMEQPKLGEPEN